MPRTKEQYEKIRDEKRNLFKETALSLFAEKGYEATSIDSIARAAGISKGLMYNYFTSKEELLKTIWDELINDFNSIIDTDNDGEISDGEAERFIDSVFEMCKNSRDKWKIYYQLSFQPKVVEFLFKNHDVERQNRQNQLYFYLSQKLNFPTQQFGLFSILVFLKGLGMVTTYTENIFNNDFLDSYKNFLKSIIFAPKQKTFNF